MLKTLLAASFLCAAPGIVWCAPIKYSGTFTAEGTLTEPDGTIVPFQGKVLLTLSTDTTMVKGVFGDGGFAGFAVVAPVSLYIEGLGGMKSLLAMEAYSVKYSLEFDGYKGDVLLPTFAFNYSGFYNLKTAYQSEGSWQINVFNMGVMPTTRGNLVFTEATSPGELVATLEESPFADE